MTEGWQGFDHADVPVPGGVIHVRTGGAGPAVLLLHGYPQTHAMWHHQAPALVAGGYRVIAADLRGYGDSVSLSDDFSFRALASDMVAAMDVLGHGAFHVVGHDRGARVAHRMVLDHPSRVNSVALLDIVPTLDVWRLMDAELGLRYYHWFFLAQGGGLPERLISGDPLTFLRHTLGGLGGAGVSFDPEALVAYERAARKDSVVAAWCADYRAAATVDPDHDRADAGRTQDHPTLVLWGDHGVVPLRDDPLTLWRAWLPRAQGRGLPGGHFIAEECPEETTSAMLEHLASVVERG